MGTALLGAALTTFPAWPAGAAAGQAAATAGSYSIVVLTQDNPTMAYGITTIETIARAINHDLRAAAG
ncbi:MAG TPA: hypothetical protein VHN16_17425 [Streptosporangiaceae bacterium]|nr:hypothetical protein [Streptosporangiaceae bacterium]